MIALIEVYEEGCMYEIFRSSRYAVDRAGPPCALPYRIAHIENVLFSAQIWLVSQSVRVLFLVDRRSGREVNALPSLF